VIIIITNNITHNSIIKPLLCLIILACGGVVNRQGRKPLKHPEKKGKEEKGRSPKAAPKLSPFYALEDHCNRKNGDQEQDIQYYHKKSLLCLIILARGGVVNRQGRKPLKHPEKICTAAYYRVQLPCFAVPQQSAVYAVYAAVIAYFVRPAQRVHIFAGLVGAVLGHTEPDKLPQLCLRVFFHTSAPFVAATNARKTRTPA